MKKLVTLLLMGTLALSATACTSSEQNNTTDDEKVARILESMDLEEKIAQMIMPAMFDEDDDVAVTQMNDTVRKAIEENGFAGYIFTDSNCQSAEQISFLTSEMQKTASGDGSSVKVPLLLSIDREGGVLDRMECGSRTSGNMAIGATGDAQNAKTEAKVLAGEAASVGLNVDFAPVIDTLTDPNNEIIGLRSFGADYTMVSSMGVSFIEGVHEENMAVSLKHFPGLGDVESDKVTQAYVLDKTEEELLANELTTFKAGIDAGADMIMTSNAICPQIEKDTYTSVKTGEKVEIPTAVSDDMINGVLRNKLGYDGVVVSSMNDIWDDFDEIDAAEMAINAGADILLKVGNITTDEDVAELEEYIEGIKERVEKGSISEETIDKAVTRILNLKKDRGLLDQTDYWKNLSDEDIKAKAVEASANMDSEEHHEKVREVINKAITVLKNENEAIPAKGNVTILVPADKVVDSVKETIDSFKEQGEIAKDIEIEVLSYEKLTAEEVSEEVLRADEVIALSVTESATDLDPEAEEDCDAAKIRAALDATHDNGSKFVLLSRSLPYDAAAYQDADAIVLSYGTTLVAENGKVINMGPNFKASMAVIFGSLKATGKLPVDIPVLNEDYSYTDEILYPRGYSAQ